MANLSVEQLRKAIVLQEKIESLQKELEQVLAGITAAAATSAAPAPKKRGRKPKSAAEAPAKVPAKRGRKPGSAKSAESGKPARTKRSSSPSGPLAPAVKGILERATQPMKTRDIFEALAEQNYQWTNSNPMANLSARLYTMPGVQRVGSGLFQLEGKSFATQQAEQ